MSSASPVDQYGNKSGTSGYGSGQSDSAKSPLSMSLGFLKNLTEKKSARGMLGLEGLLLCLKLTDQKWMAKPQRGEDQSLIASLP